MLQALSVLNRIFRADGFKGVATPSMERSVAKALNPMVTDYQSQRSEAIQRRTGRTFYVATRFLPKRVREATFVLYAFFRIADEVVDDPSPAPASVQHAQLDEIQAAALGEVPSDDPVLQAFAEIKAQVGIPDEEVTEFISAMRSDIDATGYDTYADLEEYLRGSSVAVANMMMAIMDVPEPEKARPHAKALGEAFQLTNFLRDVREDVLEYDRIYLPRETLKRFDTTEEAIRDLDSSQAVRRVIEAELHRAEQRYRKGVEGIRFLPKDCQFPVLLATVLYAEHHRKIRAINGNVLEQRPTLGLRDYFRLVVLTRWHWWRLGDPESVFYRVSPVRHHPSSRERGTVTDSSYIATLRDRVRPRISMKRRE